MLNAYLLCLRLELFNIKKKSCHTKMLNNMLLKQIIS